MRDIAVGSTNLGAQEMIGLRNIINVSAIGAFLRLTLLILIGSFATADSAVAQVCTVGTALAAPASSSLLANRTAGFIKTISLTGSVTCTVETFSATNKVQLLFPVGTSTATSGVTTGINFATSSLTVTPVGTNCAVNAPVVNLRYTLVRLYVTSGTGTCTAQVTWNVSFSVGNTGGVLTGLVGSSDSTMGWWGYSAYSGATVGAVLPLTQNVSISAYEITCTVAALTDYKLPTVHASNFDANGRAGKTKIAIQATGCQTPNVNAYTNVLGTWTFTEQEANVIKNSAAGGSTNTGCRLTQASTSAAIGNNTVTTIGTATTSSFTPAYFYVEYQRYTGATTAAVGDVTCAATLTLSYS
ncbi:hypothetical protein [Leptothrix sp. BB-3]